MKEDFFFLQYSIKGLFFIFNNQQPNCFITTTYLNYIKLKKNIYKNSQQMSFKKKNKNIHNFECKWKEG